MLKKWLREPLLHFLLIGAALFILYGLQNNQPASNENRIVISEADIDRLLSLWEKKWQRLPTQSELDGMIEAQIREEVFYRESLAMGLDQNDAIVRRRLAQKVEFIFSDLASQTQPSETELTDYLAQHADKFEIPARISFQQIYLNTDKRGEQALADAKVLLNSLSQHKSSIDIPAAGDPFMFGQSYEELTGHGVARQFGKEFSSALFKLSPGAWQGGAKVVPEGEGGFSQYDQSGRSTYYGPAQGGRLQHSDGSSSRVLELGNGEAAVSGRRGTSILHPDTELRLQDRP